MAKLIGGKLAGKEVLEGHLGDNLRNYPVRLKINGRWFSVSQFYELRVDGNFHFVAIQLDADELQEKFGDNWWEAMQDGPN
jgi:hypothetical protein